MKEVENLCVCVGVDVGGCVAVVMKVNTIATRSCIGFGSDLVFKCARESDCVCLRACGLIAITRITIQVKKQRGRCRECHEERADGNTGGSRPTI